MTPSVDLKFEAPGPGTWMLDTQHNPKPMTRFAAENKPRIIGETMIETWARYGLLIMRTSIAVNGFPYGRVHSFGTEPGSSEAPRLDDPAVQERLSRAVDRFRDKYWQAERREWFEIIRPDSIGINLALASVDVTRLDKDELFDHLAACRNNEDEMTKRHHTFNIAATLPTAILLTDVAEWTGIPPADAMSLLDGATPISAGITPELVELAKAVRDDDEAKSVVMSGSDAAEIFEQLRELPGKIGVSAERFWFMDGHRLATGFDITDKNAYELPVMLLENLKNTIETGPPDQTAQAEVVANFVRNQVPSDHRETFDEELADARASIPIKDERGLYNDVWAAGITRKALLEAGSRLSKNGRLPDREHFMEADWEEMQAIWNGSGGPSGEELAERRKIRMSLTFRDAPPFLGPPPSPPPEMEGLPPEVMRMNTAQATLGQIMGQRPPPQDGEDLVGVTANKGIYEGTARVVVGDYSFDRIQTGDVLVTSTHSEAFNVIVQKLGAIVADTGGPLSHLSIVSREIGIPCVVTCKNATVLIKDGDRVRVDGESGRVTILE